MHMPSRQHKIIIKKQGSGRPVVAVIGSVHGDEPVGSKIVEKINQLDIIKGTLITIIANPRALSLGKRYLASDLNRSFPGSASGDYEERIAAELLPIIKKADYVLDIHSTTTNTNGLVITKNTNQRIKNILNIIAPPKVVIMPKGIGDKSLINFCDGVSLEYGTHEDPKTFKQSLKSVLLLLSTLKVINKKIIISKSNTKYYKIYGEEIKPKKFIMNTKIKNFHFIKKGELLGFVDNKKVLATDGFYPILFGPKAYPKIMGFKAKKIKSLSSKGGFSWE